MYYVATGRKWKCSNASFFKVSLALCWGSLIPDFTKNLDNRQKCHNMDKVFMKSQANMFSSSIYFVFFYTHFGLFIQNSELFFQISFAVISTREDFFFSLMVRASCQIKNLIRSGNLIKSLEDRTQKGVLTPLCSAEWGHKLRVRLIPLVEVWQMDSFWWSGNHFKPASRERNVVPYHHPSLILGDFTARGALL